MRTMRGDAVIVFGADAGARVLGFLASAHLARTFGKEGFGAIVIGLSFLSYALWFADLGLATLGTRELGREPSARLYAPHEILWTRLLLACSVMAPAIGLAALLYRDAPIRWVVCAFLLNAVGYALTLEWYYQGIQRYLPLIISRTVSAALYLGLLYAFVTNATDLERAPIIYVIATLIPALLMFPFKRREDSFSPRGLSLRRSAAIIRHAATIGVGGIFAQTVQLLPPLVLGAFSMADAGLLGAALRIVAVMLIIDRVFAVLFLPAVTKLLARDREGAARQLERVLALVIVAGFAVAVPLTIYAAAVMRIVFGAPYESGAAALAVTAWFAAVTLINSVFSYALIGAGEERAYLRATVTSGIATALVTVVFVSLWGLLGAALAMAASEIIVVTLTALAFRQVVRLRFVRPLIVAGAIAAGMIAAAAALGLRSPGLAFLWQAPLACLLFLAFAFVAGAFKRDDLQWVMRR